MSLIDQTATTIERFGMIAPGDSVLVAVSGGPDSMALLHVLRELAPRWDLSLAVAHLNHGLRPGAAEREAAFVHNTAQKYKVPFWGDTISLDPTGGSIEERARRVRYSFLIDTAQSHGFNKIALGHHADDNAEAVLMHLFRGSGIRGLGGIPPMRDPGIIRPLIAARRGDILDYLKSRGIGYMHDASNDDQRFMRNRIRHRLLPLLGEAFNPNIVAVLNRTAALCREEEAWFQRYLAPIIDSLQIRMDDHDLEMAKGPLLAAHPVVRRRLIREVLQRWQGHLQRLTAAHVEGVVDLLTTRTAKGWINLPDGIVARCTDHHLQFLKSGRRPPDRDPEAPSYEVPIESIGDVPVEIVLETAGTLCLTLVQPPSREALLSGPPTRAWFDIQALRFPLMIRNVRPGDRMAPLGMHGRQKVKEVLINAKIPAPTRRRLPLLIHGQDDILWIGGVRRSREALITESTRQAMQVDWVVEGTELSPLSGPE